MKNSYEARSERHRALQAWREAKQLENTARRWRERLLSADEQAEYERLHAVGKNPPRSLGHRAAWPAYLLLVPWSVTSIGLVWLLTEGQGSSTPPQRIALIIALLAVMFGGAVAVFSVMLRRVRVALASYEEASAQAVRDYLDHIGYEMRLRTAEREEDAASRDYDFNFRRIRSQRWPR